MSAMMRRATSFCGDAGGEPAVEMHPHRLRPFERHHLRRQNMGKLASAAAERECADAADGTSMTVGDRMRGAGQHDAELGRNDMGNALLGIFEIEQPNAVGPATLAHRPDESGSRRVGLVVAAGLGRHRMILHRESQVGAAHRPDLLLQLRESVMGVQLMQHMTIDIDEIAAVGALRDAMKIPYFVE